MPLFRNRKARDRFTRWFTIIFLIIFVAAIAGGLIVAGIASRPGTPVPIVSPKP